MFIGVQLLGGNKFDSEFSAKVTPESSHKTALHLFFACTPCTCDILWAVQKGHKKENHTTLLPCLVGIINNYSPFTGNLYELTSIMEWYICCLFFCMLSWRWNVQQTRNQTNNVALLQGRRNISKILKSPKSMLLSFNITIVGEWWKRRIKGGLDLFGVASLLFL